MKVNKTKFIQKLKQPFNTRALEKRPPLFLLPSLRPYLHATADINRVKLMCGRRSKTTLDGWNRSIKRIISFLSERGMNIFNLSEGLLLDYVFSLEEGRVSYSVVAGQKAGINFLISALRLENCWSQDVAHCYEAVLRRASAEKPRTTKANVLQLDAFRTAVVHHLKPWVQQPDKVPIPVFRALAAQTLQINNLARLADLKRLRATDVKRTELNGVPALEINWRTSKTDITYKGYTSHIIKINGDLCPYTIITNYMDRMGFDYGDGPITDISFLFCRTQFYVENKQRIWVADGSHILDSKTLLRDINTIYSNLGFIRRITGKSAKVLGVSLAFSAGLSEDDIRILGRWRSADTARHYRDISPEKLLSIGAGLTKATMPRDEFHVDRIENSRPVQVLSSADKVKPQVDKLIINTTEVISDPQKIIRPVEYIKLFCLKSDWIKNPLLDEDGFPIPLVVPRTKVEGEDELEFISSKITVVKLCKKN